RRRERGSGALPRPFGAPRAALSGGGVVAAAGLDLVVAVADADMNFAVGAVAARVGGRIPEQVLRAQLVGDFLEGLRQIFLPVDVNHSPSGLVGEFAQHRLTVVARALAMVKTRVADVDGVDDDVRLLGGLER